MTRSALENAASSAALVLTTESLLPPLALVGALASVPWALVIAERELIPRSLAD